MWLICAHVIWSRSTAPWQNQRGSQQLGSVVFWFHLQQVLERHGSTLSMRRPSSIPWNLRLRDQQESLFSFKLCYHKTARWSICANIHSFETSCAGLKNFDVDEIQPQVCTTVFVILGEANRSQHFLTFWGNELIWNNRTNRAKKHLNANAISPFRNLQRRGDMITANTSFFGMFCLTSAVSVLPVT